MTCGGHFAFALSPIATRRRIACARVSVLSPDEAIHASIADSSEGCQRSPTWRPLPVGAGPRLFFGTTLVFAINRGTIEADQGEGPTSAPALARATQEWKSKRPELIACMDATCKHVRISD
jgi:hypothetical protein